MEKEAKNYEVEFDREELEGMEDISVPIDPVKDKDFIEKWGLESDIDPEADLDADGHLVEEEEAL